MKRRILSAFVLSCLVFLSSTVTLSVFAAEDEAEPETVDETDDVAEISADQEETEYINGMPVDYDDPECQKYLRLQESESTADASMPQTLSSGYTTSWGGTTYTHKASVAEGKTILPGIDVSKWEGDIDWNKVAKSGIEFAFMRIGYTGANTGGHNLDPYYTTNMKNAIVAGIKVGIYYYSQAITVAEAESEAQYVLDNLGGYQLDLPIIIDYEYYYNSDGSSGRLSSSTPSKSTKTSIVNAFCKKIEAKGYTAGLYADKDMLTNSLNTSEIDNNYEIWMAQWRTSESNYSRSYQYWQCGGASVDGISGNVDLDWGYFLEASTNTSNSTSTGTDIVNMDGKWVYTVNGTPDYSYTGVAKNNNGWWYVENGVVDFSYYGFAQNENGWWYIEDGKVTFNKNSVIQDTKKKINGKSDWWYVVESKVQTSFTGLADYSNSNGWWYINNGKVTFDVNTVAKNKNGWWYVLGSKVQFGFTGLADYSNSNGWWYISSGKVTFNVDTVAKKKNGWWYVKNSKVDFGYNGIAQNKNGWWYIKNGKVDFSYNGKVTVSGKTYSVHNGEVAK